MPKKPVRPRKAAPAPKRTIEVTIQEFSEDGSGLVRHEGKELLVPGTIPGEKVVAAVEREGQRRIIGRLLKLVESSPQRGKAPCLRARQCQGCALIHLTPEAQLTFKEQTVRRAIEAYPRLRGAKVQPIWAAPHTLGYRTSAKLVIAKTRGAVKIGLYRRGTHDVVDIGGCPIHHPLINRIVEVVREEIEKQNLSVYQPLHHSGLLRYLTIRVSPEHNKALVTFVTRERDFRQVTNLIKWLRRKIPQIIGIHQNINPSQGNIIFGRETMKMQGAVDLIDRVGEIDLHIAPTAFFQVNNPQAARIYDLVRRWIAARKDEHALDLYCGIGGISLNLASDAASVVGVELSEAAVASARLNAQRNNRTNCSFFAGDAAALLEHLPVDIPVGSPAVVNPPRTGCDTAVLDALAERRPRALVYVSCNPRTLARDLDHLATRGMRTVELQPVDMFPQTVHIETVALLVPAKQ